jgi:hypothetical protein
MTQLSIIDAATGATLKQAGLDRLEHADQAFLLRMRAVAWSFGFENMNDYAPLIET